MIFESFLFIFISAVKALNEKEGLTSLNEKPFKDEELTGFEEELTGAAEGLTGSEEELTGCPDPQELWMVLAGALMGVAIALASWLVTAAVFSARKARDRERPSEEGHTVRKIY